MMNNLKNMGLSEGGKALASPSSFQLARQQSVYSLTFDEFQNTLGGPGKDFGSMNMDEFLRNIWTAEETHAMTSTLGSTANSNASGLQRQGSLTLPRTLSQKTVDEVWKDLMKESGSGQGSGGAELPQQYRQPTLGEITLEEFLVRAGVVREDNTNPQQVQQQVQRPMVGNNISTTTDTSNMNGGNSIFFGDLPGSNNNNRGLGLGFAQNGARNNAMGVATTRPYPPPLQVRGNVDVVGIGDPGMNNGLMSIGGGVVGSTGSPDGLGKGNGDLSSLSPVPYHVFGSGMRGRKCSGVVEKVVERRQRRMIKNRESAARSRARKQAYTMELEAEVATLKEQNQELEKKQEEMMEMQKNQVMEIINQQRGPKKLCLRRTLTGPW